MRETPDSCSRFCSAAPGSLLPRRRRRRKGMGKTNQVPNTLPLGQELPKRRQGINLCTEGSEFSDSFLRCREDGPLMDLPVRVVAVLYSGLSQAHGAFSQS